MDVAEPFQDGLNGTELSVHDVVDEAQFFAFRHEQAREVDPVALALSRSRRDRFVSLEHSTHVDAKGQVVVLDALAQQRCLDDIFMVIIGAHLVARGFAQAFQNLLAA